MSSASIRGGWPDAVDVANYCRTVGVTMPATDSNAVLRSVNAAISKFERLTRWHPFLSANVPETRTFDPPPNSILDLRGGVAAVPTVTVSGTAYQVGTNVWLRPDNALAEGKPITAIDFTLRPEGGFLQYAAQMLTPLYYGSGRQSLAVTGLWGYALTVPFDVAQAVIAEGVANYLRLKGFGITGGLQSWEEAGTSEKYADHPFKSTMDTLTPEFDEAVNNYRRLIVA